jgi:transposase InsO family protein
MGLEASHFKRNDVPYTEYTKKKGVNDLMKRKPRGPKKGEHTPVQDAIREEALSTKRKYPHLGAAKIAKISGVKASPKTVHAVLRKNGFENVTMRLGKVYKHFEMPHVNDMWQIDYVELGRDRITGMKVEYLSVIDDKSRFIFATDPTTHPTTDHVIDTLTDCFMKYGIPKTILSDHGTQWCASNGGDTRFDEFCEKWGVIHIMGQVRKPTTQGKVERWHGSIRREADIPKEGTLEEYAAWIREYAAFYDKVRPHWSCGLRTPEEVFYEGHPMPLLLGLAAS